MTDYSIKLSPTRDQRRELDKAARASGHRNTGPWALSVALAAARVAEPAKAAVAPQNRPQSAAEYGRTITVARADVVPPPLVKSYDPDAP